MHPPLLLVWSNPIVLPIRHNRRRPVQTARHFLHGDRQAILVLGQKSLQLCAFTTIFGLKTKRKVSEKVADFLLALVLVWLLAVASIVFFRLLTGNISTRGLIRPTAEGPVSPERIQLLVGTFAAVGYSVALALSAEDQTTPPHPPMDACPIGWQSFRLSRRQVA